MMWREAGDVFCIAKAVFRLKCLIGHHPVRIGAERIKWIDLFEPVPGETKFRRSKPCRVMMSANFIASGLSKQKVSSALVAVHDNRWLGDITMVYLANRPSYPAF
jgi:hypothetical protein